MQYSTNYNMNKPELAEQYRLSHWNENTDIIDSAMQAIRSGTDEVMRATLLNFCYPIGSLYWSSKDTDPSTLFGGTWVQIKDRFVLACGDTYTSVGATGGESSVTLTVSNMPSHSHSFTPSGTISMNAHSHGLNNHTHSFTPSGTVSTSGGIYSGLGNGWQEVCLALGRSDGQITVVGGYNENGSKGYVIKNTSGDKLLSLSSSFSGSAGTTGTASGNTASTTSSGSFTGTAGTTGSNGSGTSFSILPPYVIKYCFERTA